VKLKTGIRVMKSRVIFIAAFLIIMVFSGCAGVGDVVDDPSAVKSNDIVQLSYVMKLEDGTVLFDTFTAGAPVELTLGIGSMFPAFEKAVIGMKVGEKKTVRIPADEAYGPYRKDLIIEVPRSQIPDDQAPVVGMKLQQERPDGIIIVATILKVTDDTVTLDTNNELAGKDLIYEIEIIDIL
jgi:peptidylprolyl isomerase